jgi:hypothetical protein
MHSPCRPALIAAPWGRATGVREHAHVSVMLHRRRREKDRGAQA